MSQNLKVTTSDKLPQKLCHDIRFYDWTFYEKYDLLIFLINRSLAQMPQRAQSHDKSLSQAQHGCKDCVKPNVNFFPHVF